MFGAPMNRAFPELSQALALLLQRIDEEIRKSNYGGPPIRMYLVGGLAVNYYCGARYTEDVDAFYSKRLHTGSHVVNYRKKDGKDAYLYLDNNFNQTLRLLHQDFDSAAVEWEGVGNEGRMIRLYVLSPLDLAVTKISRFSEQDREDILVLSRAMPFRADALKDRATEALGDFIGDLSPVKLSIQLICDEIARDQELTRSRQVERPERELE